MINEAYQVPSDVKKCKKHDELRAQYQRWQRTSGNQQDFDWQNWFTQPGQGIHEKYASPEDLELINIYFNLLMHQLTIIRNYTPLSPVHSY